MPKFQQVAGDVPALRALMADRVNQAVSRNPDLFRSERGRMSDFASRYGLMRTVASRVLTGEAFPSHPLLLALSKDTNLPLDWFYGRADDADVASFIDTQPISLPIFRAPGFSVTVPAPMLAIQSPERAMLVRNGGLGNSAFVQSDDYLLVEKTETLTSGAVYAVIPHGEVEPSLYRITKSLQDATHVFKASADEPNMTVRDDAIVYGEDDLASGKILIIGKVVGRLNFYAKGVTLEQI